MKNTDSDYSFMRSGTGTTTDHGEGSGVVEDMATMCASMGVITKRAIKVATVLSEHKKEPAISKTSMKVALKLACMRIYSDGNLEKEVNEAKKEVLCDDEDDQDEGEYFAGMRIVDDIETTGNGKECPCDLCAASRACERCWNKWEPMNALQMIIKRSIDRTS